MDSNYHIDWDKTISLNAGNAELALDILQMFADELPQSRQKIEYYWKNMELENLSRIIHKLRGSCCYCSAARLGELAAEIEIAIVDNNETPSAQTVEACLTEISAIIHELETRTFATTTS